MALNTTELARGISSLYIPGSHFKTTRISVNFVLPLSAETVTANAALPFILTRSCAKYPDQTALNKKLASLYGAALAADSVKLGDAQIIRIITSALNDEYCEGESVAAECAELLCEMIFNPLFDNSGAFDSNTFQSEKRLFLERIAGEINNKRTYAISRAEGILCEGSPYGAPKYGTKEQAEQLTPAALAEAWQNMLRSAEIKIIITGGGQPAPIFESFTKAFAKISRDPRASQNSPVTAGEPKNINEEMAVSQCKLVMGFAGNIDENDENTTAFRVMTDLFGGGPYSKLFLNVRERLSLCYYCAARYNRRKGMILVDSGVEAANIEKAKAEVLAQLEAVKNGNFSDSELEASKKSLIDSAGGVSDSPSGLDNWYADQMFYKSILSPEKFAEKVKTLTRDDIIKAAKPVQLAATYLLRAIFEGN